MTAKMNSAKSIRGAYSAGLKAGAAAMKREGWKPWVEGDRIPDEGEVIKTLIPCFSGWIGLGRVLRASFDSVRVEKLDQLMVDDGDYRIRTADLLLSQVAIKFTKLEE